MSESEQSGAGRREVAYRLFAAEFDDADFSYSESDEERAPNYVITPTGARVNRLFVVGVLTEVEQVSEDVLRARVVDPTGAFVLYAGQYQPDEQAFLDGAETPMFVAVTGKARTFQPDDSNQVFTSVRPESISEVDATTRDRWTVQTAEQTLDRVGHMATALSLDVRGDDLRATLEENGVDDGLAAGIPLAIDHYGTRGAYLSELRDLALDAARLVANELDEVEGLSLDPDQGGDADLQSLADTDVDVSVTADEDASATDSSVEEPVSTETASAETTEPETVETTTESATDASDTEAVDTTVEETTTETAETDTSAETKTADTSAGAETESTESATTETVEASVAESGSDSTAQLETTEDADAEVDVDVDSTTEDDDIGDFEPGEFELDEDEREEIEEEYGTEFQSGTDVPEPGESDIETPDPEELAEAEPEAESTDTTAETAESVEPSDSAEEPTTESETAESEPEPESTATSEGDADAEDVDLEEATIEVMEELDDGDGADRETLVEMLVDRYGVDPDDVEAAIQDALMDGRCYEPDDNTVKPI